MVSIRIGFVQEKSSETGKNQKKASCCVSKLERKDLKCSDVMIPPSEIKRRWRQQQISSQLKFVKQIDATWRKKQIPGVWCGWLRKRSQGIFSRWASPQERWFELRNGADPMDSSSSRSAVLHYNGRGENGDTKEKKLTIVTARRDSSRDWEGWACISLIVSERKGGLYLLAANEYQAHALLSHVDSILAP